MPVFRVSPCKQWRGRLPIDREGALVSLVLALYLQSPLTPCTGFSHYALSRPRCLFPEILPEYKCHVVLLRTFG